MRIVSVVDEGPSSTLEIAEAPRPVPGAGEVLIRVLAAGVNRADLGQRAGAYPPPAGASPVLGLEVSGVIDSLGDEAEAAGFAAGDEVCALLSGGGYAEYVAVDAGLVLPVPRGVTLVDAAGLPEATATVWSNLALVAGLASGETLLVHGGGSGIGTMAIQIATALGARVAVTAGSADKLAACAELGADVLIDYSRSDFVAEIHRATGGRGADVILDVVGGDYLERNVAALATGGRLVVIANQSGSTGSLRVQDLMAKRASVSGTTLRSRPLEERRAIIAAVRDNVWPLVEQGLVRPIVHDRFGFDRAEAAHETMRRSSHLGKILLMAGPDARP